MQYIATCRYHIRYEEPWDNAGTEPEEVWCIAIDLPSDAQAYLQREPKTKDVHGRLDEKPGPGQYGPAALLLQFENCQPTNLASPLPVILQYGAERAQKPSLPIADTNRKMVPQLYRCSEFPKETPQVSTRMSSRTPK